MTLVRKELEKDKIRCVTHGFRFNFIAEVVAETAPALVYIEIKVTIKRAVLRIHDILGWIRIRIRGSMPLTNGSGSGSWIRILLFSSLTFKMPAKN
jgi:hypothetical protein